MTSRRSLLGGIRVMILVSAGFLLSACASYDINTLFFTFHTSRVSLLPEFDPRPRMDTLYSENSTWMVEGQYFHLELGHDTSLTAYLQLLSIPSVGETLLVSDTSMSVAWVGGDTRSVGRIGWVVGIPYSDSGGRFETWIGRNHKGHTITSKWAVRYRLEWMDPAGRENWVQGEAHILKTRYRTKDNLFN